MKAKEVATIYGIVNAGRAINYGFEQLDKLYPKAVFGFDPGIIGDIAVGIGGAIASMKLKEPWSLIAVLLGAEATTDLWRTLPKAMAPKTVLSQNATAVPPRTFEVAAYIPRSPPSIEPAVRYQITDKE